MSKTTKSTRGRPLSRPVSKEGELGTIAAVAAYMNLPAGYLYDAHRAAIRRAKLGQEVGLPNPNFVRGGKTCAEWVKDWLARNPDFTRREVNPA